jgi:pyrroline-5-carboxylate reductase
MDKDVKDNVTYLAEMYATFFSAAYNKLMAQGLPKNIAHETALEILKQQMIGAVKVAEGRNKNLEAIMSGIDINRKGS